MGTAFDMSAAAIPRQSAERPSLAAWIDRWMFFITATWLTLIVLTGFVPDSFAKIAAVAAGRRAPFPWVMHLHAVLMGSWMLLLMAQTWLMATGKRANHRALGRIAMVLAPAMVVTGFVLVPTMYGLIAEAARTAPPDRLQAAMRALNGAQNTMLIQARNGILFSAFVLLGLRARKGDPGMHKRLMILASWAPISAAINRIGFLPTTMPFSSTSTELWQAVAIAPMILWDVIRSRQLHRAYLVAAGVILPFIVLMHLLWDKPAWHAVAARILG